MTAVQKHLGITMLLMSCAAAQNNGGTAAVQKVTAVRQGSDLRVEITLSAPVKPAVEMAANPNRILLDFPDTICNDSTKNISVHSNGVRMVRTAQHSTTPSVTRVVLDLDEVHPYIVTADGNRIILTVEAAEKPRAVPHGAPVAATSGNLISVFRRRRDNNVPVIDDQSSGGDEALPGPPPPPNGPAFEPPSDNSTAAAPPPEQPRPVLQSQPVTVSPQSPAGQAIFVPNPIASARPAATETSTTPASPIEAATETSTPPVKEESTEATPLATEVPAPAAVSRAVVAETSAAAAP